MSERLKPIHVVYGGAHLFKSTTARKLTDLARQVFEQECPNPASLARVFSLQDHSGDLATRVHERVRARLSQQAIQDYRIDFEDGYGPRPDAEEDGHARSAALAVEEGLAAGTLPPLIGIRTKAFSDATEARATRTMDLFFETLTKLPPRFAVTIPKVTEPGEIEVLSSILSRIEKQKNWDHGSIEIEFMVETPESLYAPDGRAQLPGLVKAAEGRCRSAHLGAYDYLSSCGVAAQDQGLSHAGCYFVRSSMQAMLASTGVRLVDGATTRFPVGDPVAIHAAWGLSYRNIRAAYAQGFHQGWDLHPAQIPVRYVATYVYYLESLADVTERLKRFLGASAQAVLAGGVFDDAATGQGLLNHLIQGLDCGALTVEEAQASGIGLAELKTRSFAEILAKRTAPRP